MHVTQVLNSGYRWSKDFSEYAKCVENVGCGMWDVGC